MNTVSLEVAKRLKEAGWAETTYGYFNPRGLYTRLTQIPPDDQHKFISAPTLGELMRALPAGSELHRAYFGDIDKWYCVAGGEEYYSDTPEDAAANAWIALQEGEK